MPNRFQQIGSSRHYEEGYRDKQCQKELLERKELVENFEHLLRNEGNYRDVMKTVTKREEVYCTFATSIALLPLPLHLYFVELFYSAHHQTPSWFGKKTLDRSWNSINDILMYITIVFCPRF